MRHDYHNYLTMFMKVKEASYKLGANGLDRYVAIREFNTRFLNPDFYKTHQPSEMMLDVETNRFPPRHLAHTVMDLCRDTNVCQQYGVSFFELMQMDLYSFTKFKEHVLEAAEEKIKVMDEITNKNKARAAEIQHKEQESHVRSSTNSRKRRR